ncbi:MAG TPA: glutaredoxin family protein [Phycisphaerae bacterium]|nr:glutaredoxin family protein [Phycisphaerae bacterium]
MHQLTLMVKPNCPACDAARRVIELVVVPRGTAIVEEVDITEDPELLEKYKDDVPVILLDGQEKFRKAVDPDKLARLFNDEFGGRLVGFD